MAQLKLVDVTKRFGDVIAVHKLNLDVEQGECFSFLGPSGCGKTTTLRMIAGFEDLDEGELSVDGKIFSSSFKKYYLPPEQRDFGMVFQAFAVWPHLTVSNNVAFPLQIRKLPKHEIAERVKMALQSTGLTHREDNYPTKLSGGEQQRIALARAIAINPKVMLLDEPLSNLDAKLREEMRFEIKDLQKKFGFTIIYVTHDQAEAMALSDRMLVMDHGIVQQVGKPLEIYDKPANRFVFSFIGLSNFIDVDITGTEARIPAGTSGATGPGLLASRLAPMDLGPRAFLACRPSDIDFVSGGEHDATPAFEAFVARRTYLGDIIDYKLVAGSAELRVQKPRHSKGPREGERCMVRINRTLWYKS
jgi:iron(III) transport system ATP-binding protein